MAPPTMAATPAKTALPVIWGMPAVLELDPAAVAPAEPVDDPEAEVDWPVAAD